MNLAAVGTVMNNQTILWLISLECIFFLVHQLEQNTLKLSRKVIILCQEFRNHLLFLFASMWNFLTALTIMYHLFESSATLIISMSSLSSHYYVILSSGTSNIYKRFSFDFFLISIFFKLVIFHFHSQRWKCTHTSQSTM